MQGQSPLGSPWRDTSGMRADSVYNAGKRSEFGAGADSSSRPPWWVFRPRCVGPAARPGHGPARGQGLSPLDSMPAVRRLKGKSLGTAAPDGDPAEFPVYKRPVPPPGESSDDNVAPLVRVFGPEKTLAPGAILKSPSSRPS